MLKSINVTFNYECDICHQFINGSFRLKVSIDGKKFSREGWDAVEELAELNRARKSLSEWTVRLNKNGDIIDVCPNCSKWFRGEHEILCMVLRRRH
jgi:hypothetical protein